MPRGKTKFYSWGNSKRNITSLLSEKRIYDLVPGTTYGSKREAIRAMLENGDLTYDKVKDLPDLGPTTRADYYGSQRRRAKLPLKRTTGEVVQGPRLTHDEDYDGEFDPFELPPGHKIYGGFRVNGPLRNNFGQVIEGPRRLKRPYVRKGGRTLLVINGKRVSSKRALVIYPKLREYLQTMGKKGVRDSTLAKRLLKAYRESKVPESVTSLRGANITQDLNHRIRGDIISHHNLLNHDRELSILECLEVARPKVIEFLSNNLLNKAQLILKCELEKKDGYTDTTFFRSKQHSLIRSSDLGEVYDVVSKEIMKQFDEYMGRDSGVTLKWVQQLDITLSEYNPLDLSGSSYIPLPRKVALTKGVINMKNDDEQCFKWSVTRFLNPVEAQGERVTSLLKQQAEELDWTGVKFPTPVIGNSISNFEKNNNVGVLVIGYDENEKYIPVRVPSK